jgi:hypothetical protein
MLFRYSTPTQLPSLRAAHRLEIYLSGLNTSQGGAAVLVGLL